MLNDWLFMDNRLVAMVQMRRCTSVHGVTSEMGVVAWRDFFPLVVVIDAVLLLLLMSVSI